MGIVFTMPRKGPMKTEAIKHPARKPALRAAFHAGGLRLTRQRLAIYRELEGRYDHPDVDRLFKAVKPRIPKISLFTVYRTMNALETAGLVWRVATWRGHARYDANTSTHMHFLCEACGRIDDVMAEAVQMPPSPMAGSRAVVRRMDVMMTGTCEACVAAQIDAREA